MERSFSLLKVNGVLDRVGGILLGKHELFDDGGTGKRPWEVLLEVMGLPCCPVLAEFDCCHTHPMLTLPLGVEAELDADGQTLTPYWVHGCKIDGRHHKEDHHSGLTMALIAYRMSFCYSCI